MTIDTKIRFLTWAAFFVWAVVVVNFCVYSFLWIVAGMLVGPALDGKTAAWLLIQIFLLILIPIAYFFAVRRLLWNIPPEDCQTDRMSTRHLVDSTPKSDNAPGFIADSDAFVRAQCEE